ncbi:MAG: hypothetical protein EOO39_49220 [Cytophagaceae bacterium]|nr:MAG: hypothetical protein EOO39_49220 [Cytophagaceae bacterium]
MNTIAPKKLTNAQAALLELLNIDMSDTEIDELRRVLMQHFRARLEAEVESSQKRKGKTTAQMEKEMKFVNRTDRLKAIRQQDK